MIKRPPTVPMGFVCALIAFASPVHAAIQTETESASYGTPASPLPLGSSATLSVGAFDTSLGTLDSVTITMTSFDTVTSDVFNYAMGNLSYSDATATVPVTVTATVPVNVTPLIGLTTSATGAAGPASGTVSAGACLTVASTSFLPQASTIASIAPGDFSLYEGAGDISINLTVANLAGTYSGTSGSGLFFGGNGFSYGSIEVDYGYTAPPAPPSVPEPGAIGAGLAALSLCGIRLARQLRRIRGCSQG